MIWEISIVVLAVLGLVPGILQAATGSSLHRLIGLQLVSVAAIMVTLALSVMSGQTSYLIVPLVLAVVSPTGVLVFTRLLRPDPATPGAQDPDSVSGAGS
ncbi:MAG: MrpF/PhaF family protein [Microlunatus sp.]|nr:MrpF/PhaF family protein [Microlunatus sp.]